MGLLDGLLPEDPQQKEAARMALLAASLGMLSGRGRNFGEIAGKAGLMGLGTYNNQMAEAQKAAERKRVLDLQAQQEARIAEMQNLQMQQMRGQAAERQRMQNWMEQDFAGMGQPQAPGGAPAGAGGQFPLMGAQQQGPRVDPRQLPSIANTGASGVETFPVPGPFDPPPQAAEGAGEMERLVREAAMGGDRYAPPPSPEQQLMNARRQSALQRMQAAKAAGDVKAYMDAKAELDAPMTLDTNKRYVLPGGGTIEPPTKPEALSDVGKLLNEQSKYGKDTATWKWYEDILTRKAEGEMPADWRLFKQQNPNGTYAQFRAEQREDKRAGAVQVNVGKETPPQVVKELAELSGDRDQLTRLVTDFKPEFGGDFSETVGRAKNEIGMRLGDESGRAQWWQEYQDYTNRVRNRLFGSALTPTEKREFDRAMVHPGMDANEIRKNLERQARAVSAATNKLANVYGAGTYNKDQIEKATAPTNQPSAAPLTAAEKQELEELRKRFGNGRP